MKQYLLILMVAVGFFGASGGQASEDACALIEHLPLPQGLQKTGFQRSGEGQCEVTYQTMMQPADALFRAFHAGLERAGWKIIKENMGSLGFAGSFQIQAFREGWGVDISLGQALMFQQVRIGMRPLTSEEKRLALAFEDARALLARLEKMPRPEGVRRLGMELTARPEAALRYGYAGDLQQAFTAFVQRLQADHWQIERQKWSAMAGVTGGEVEASRGGFHFEARFSAMPMAMGAMIEYRLRPMK